MFDSHPHVIQQVGIGHWASCTSMLLNMVVLGSPQPRIIQHSAVGCCTSASSEMLGWGLELVFVRKVGLSFPQLGWPGAHIIWPAWLSFRPPCCCLAILIVVIAI